IPYSLVPLFPPFSPSVIPNTPPPSPAFILPCKASVVSHFSHFFSACLCVSVCVCVCGCVCVWGCGCVCEREREYVFMPASKTCKALYMNNYVIYLSFQTISQMTGSHEQC